MLKFIWMQSDEQTISDLEFDTLKNLLAEYCKSLKAKKNALGLRAFKEIPDLKRELAILQEIKCVHEDDAVVFPHPNSEDIDHALKLLDISNGVLTLQEVVKIYKLCLGTKELIDFAKKHQEEFPLVYQACAHIDSLKDVLKIIRNVLTPNLDIKDEATHNLSKIRSAILSNQKNVNKNFEKALQHYRSLGILGENEESFLDYKRLLTVQSAYKKKVKGKAHGVSAKGNYIYIEPQENIELNKYLEQLKMDEHNEILEILSDLSNRLRSERKNLEAFQRLLVRFDLYNAKVLLAISYNGVQPKMSRRKKMYWKNAVHPLLFLKNKELNLKTIGQELELDPNKRFLVISGPNAGGKSITLKTIGLLQMMFQCGLFVPVDDVSEFYYFEQIFSDIGDNQSIDNQLSTYSYKLARMQYFLKNAGSESLILLDEFGSGSDPELGGALAEVFFEELYAKNGFAAINTHYTNIKILSSNLPQAQNACMLFDDQKLAPLYQLSIGQPGSSFTFEVAEINGIDPQIIQAAKQKVSENKVKLDQLAIDLQKEKSKFSNFNQEQLKQSVKAQKTAEDYEAKLEMLHKKALQQQRFLDQQNKFISAGKKLYEFIQKFKKHKTNNALNEAVLKFIAIEKSKTLEKKNPDVFQQNLKAPKLPKQEVNKKQKEIAEKKQEVIAESKRISREQIKIGDKVKIADYNKPGIVTKIKDEHAEVQIGNFKIKTKINSLDLIF